MMELTRKAEYAIRGMLYLARTEEGQSIMIGEIAREMQAPQAFLAKIFQVLGDKGLIRSYKGQGGGFALARPAQMITLGQIVEAVEGPIMPNTCLMDDSACAFKPTCPVHPVWRRLQAVTKGILEEVSLKSLAQGM
ncbi:MAG: Rrf2 family transcriptional regulator [Syntrophaceae bacterium]